MENARRDFLKFALLSGLPVRTGGFEEGQQTRSAEDLKIKRVDLIHFLHTDFGWTDHPAVCRQIHKRCLDIAVDACLATAERPPEGKFCWTAESISSVYDWWQEASAPRREQLLRAVRCGQLDITALPFNIIACLNGDQWEQMVHWVPDELFQQFRPRTAIQIDSTPPPRAAAMKLLDRGVRYFITNASGNRAFWWKMPDGRRMFVWSLSHYAAGFVYFEPHDWWPGRLQGIPWERRRAGYVADTRYWPPRPGDFFRTDEEYVRKAHRHCVEELRRETSRGYPHDSLLLSIVNQWRLDNDPPFPALADFVAAWSRLELKPVLRLVTASEAMERLEEEMGDKIPEYEGDFTGSWANGIASGPRELAASRFAKRFLRSAQSPVWGALDGDFSKRKEEILKDLCLFDEHSWGSALSAVYPYGLDTVGQYAEKSNLAYRAMAMSELLLSQRARTRLAREKLGLYIANTTGLPFSGWVRIPAFAFRDEYQSVEDTDSGATSVIHFESGPKWEDGRKIGPDSQPRAVAKVWVEKLAGNTIQMFRLSTRAVQEVNSQTSSSLVSMVDGHGWPISATWPGMNRPLFLPGIGDFLSRKIAGSQPEGTPVPKDVYAVAAGKAEFEDSPHTVACEQRLQHPRLEWATRRLEIWKREPRARLTLRINRLSSDDAESLYVLFPMPAEGILPRISNGGVPLVAYRDQVPGSSSEYFAIDGWVHYATPNGHWFWVSRDAAIVSFGSIRPPEGSTHVPSDAHRVLAMIFDNRYAGNFVGNSHGVMEFQFDVAWKGKLDGQEAEHGLAESLTTDPLVVINPGLPEHPLYQKHLYRV